MEALQQFGISLIQSMQTMSPALDGLMNFFTFLGRVEFYLIIIPFLYWAIDKRVGIRALLILLFVDAVGDVFKLLLHQPRPYWVGDVKQLTEEATYGIPSTHASDSLAVGGFLGSQLKRTWFWVVVILVLFFIGYSRLYLGAHFPHDVLFGWLIGAIVLWAFLKWADQVSSWANSKTLSTQIGTGFALSVGFILIGLLSHALIAGTPDTGPWLSFATKARSISQFFTLSGALFGAIAGYSLMRQSARFQSSGDWVKRGLSYLLGMIGLLVIYIGLDVVFASFAPDQTIPRYALRYIRYATVTLWVTFAAPWIFLKFKMAEAET